MQHRRRLMMCRLTPQQRLAAPTPLLLREQRPRVSSNATDDQAGEDVRGPGKHEAAAAAVAAAGMDGAGFSSSPRLSTAARLKAATTPSSSPASPSRSSRAAGAGASNPAHSSNTKTGNKAKGGKKKSSRWRVVDGQAVSETAVDVDELLAGVSTARTIVPPTRPPAATHHHEHHGHHDHRNRDEGEVVFDELERVSPPLPQGADDAREQDTTAPGTISQVSPSPFERAPSQLSPLERTRRSLNIGETVTSGAAHASLEQMERRRSKFTVGDTEFEMGITERLFPEIRRLPALHEVHYGDATVREVDSSVYFGGAKASTPSACAQGPAADAAEGTEGQATAAAEDVQDHGCEEEDGVDDAALARFDAETTKQFAHITSADTPSPDAVPVAVADEKLEDDAGGGAAAEAEEVRDLVLRRGTQTPWFIQTGHAENGAIRLQPLPPADCLRLLTFLLKLRNQALEDLPKALQRKASAAVGETRTEGQEASDTVGAAAPAASSQRQQRGTLPLTMADVIKYLDTAPAPVVGLTESLHDPLTKRPPASPAFLFTLYMENVSFHNAIAHLAALFSVPIKSFHSHSTPSKMSCATILCSVARNTLTREHLLLINTLRLPGFVLRVSGVREVPETDETRAIFAQKHEDAIAGELARWDALYETEMLLRRVSARSTQELVSRLRAVQQLGAVFFTAGREASLARSATDILHGFYKSAVINALQRQKQPKEVKEFMLRPNVVTASRARRVSTDAAVRQLLRTFIQTNGQWQEAVRRTPFHWRHRWLNALRSLMWNKMASQRIRVGGRQVMVGDAVVRAEYRDDVQRRMIPTITFEHVKFVETEEEAARCSLEDVFIPFLRGAYPADGFAPESTNHPIMTRTNMLALLREHHAPQLLLGLPDEARLLLDGRAHSGVVLWRRLLIRPVAMQFTILEDKAPIKSVHFDAGRILANDRWAAYGPPHRSVRGAAAEGQSGAAAATSSASSPSPPSAIATAAPQPFPSATSALLPQSFILEHSTIGARLRSGLLAEEFFDIPSAENYIVLGQARRHLDGAFVAASPHTPAAELGDRMYTLHLRAMTRTGAAGLTQMLREYFILSGIEQERDSALQHKVHRIRRELDPETPLLTALTYCEVCYNRDHHDKDTCAEYFFKVNKRSHEKLIEASLKMQRRHRVSPSGFAAAPTNTAAERHEQPSQNTSLLAPAATDRAVVDDGVYTVFLDLHLRRGQGQKWGVNLTKSLRLTGLDDPALVKHGALSVARGVVGLADDNDDSSAAQGADEEQVRRVPWPPELLLHVRKHQMLHRDFEELQSARVKSTARPTSRTDPTGASTEDEGTGPRAGSAATTTTTLNAASASHRGGSARKRKEEAAGIMQPHAANVIGVLSALLPADALQRLVVAARTPTEIPLAPAIKRTQRTAGDDNTSAAATAHTPPPPPHMALAAKFPNRRAQMQSNGLLKSCAWRLISANGQAVQTASDVARVFVKLSKDLEVRVTFATCVRLADLGGATPQGAKTPQAITAAVSDTEPPATPLAEAAAAAAAHATPPSRLSAREVVRWLNSLPDTVNVMLTKTTGEASSTDPHIASWGVRLHTRDMTLVNFSQMLLHGMGEAAAAAPSSASTRGGERKEKEAAVPRQLHVRVAINPPEIVGEAQELFHSADAGGIDDAIFARIAPALDAMYNVTRMNGVVVTSKHAVSATLQALRQRIARSAAAPASHAEGGHTFTHLPLVLKRRVDSCSNAEKLLHELDAASPAGIDGTGSPSTAASAADGGDKRVANANAVTETPRDEGLNRMLNPLVPCLPNQSRMTSEQLQHSLATLAVNRLLLNAQTAGRWGLKIQRGTRRLKYIQFNRFFTFQVFAAKRNHAVRLQDTLRFLPPSASSSAPASSSASPAAETEAHGLASAAHDRAHASSGVREGGGVKTAFSHYAYLINAVNHERVGTFDELRRALHLAALPHEPRSPPQNSQEQQQPPLAGDGGRGDAEEAAALAQGPESVTLSVKQYRLMRLTAVIRRGGGPGEPSPLAPVGLSINNSLVVLGVEQNSPMATAILHATEEASSLRRLIGKKAGTSPFSHTHGRGKGLLPDGHPTAAHGPEQLRRTALSSSVVVAPVLARVLESVLAAAGAPTTKATVAAEGRRRRAGQYDVDEDEEEEKTSTGGEEGEGRPDTERDKDASRTGPEVDGDRAAALRDALRNLADTCQKVWTELDRSVAIDAVHLLQVSLLQDFALSHLRRCDSRGEREAAAERHAASPDGDADADAAAAAASTAELDESILPELEALVTRLEEVHAEVCWRVIHAVHSGAPLRTTQDVANAIAPGVAEEGLVLQQCLAAV